MKNKCSTARRKQKRSEGSDYDVLKKNDILSNEKKKLCVHKNK